VYEPGPFETEIASRSLKFSPASFTTFSEKTVTFLAWEFVSNDSSIEIMSPSIDSATEQTLVEVSIISILAILFAKIELI
jgi:hypothetical protein